MLKDGLSLVHPRTWVTAKIGSKISRVICGDSLLRIPWDVTV